MKKFKKLNWQHIIVVICLLSIFLIPYFVFAQGAGTKEENAVIVGEGVPTAKDLLDEAAGKRGAGYDTGPGKGNVGSVVASAINGFLMLIGIIFLIRMIYGGYLWMSAHGSEEKVTEAKGIIQNSIIGVIIIIAAYAIVYFVFEALLNVRGGSGDGGHHPL